MAFNPLSPLGVAATTVQFISFTQNLVRRTVLKDGQLEAKAQHFDREHAALSLECLSKELEKSDGMDVGENETTESLQAIARECSQVARELLSALSRIRGCKPHQSGRAASSKTFADFRLALRSLWSEEKIAQLESRLRRFRDQLVLNLLVSLR
jgi:hypothetical protein